MYILHIETSTKICSVALSREDTLLECIDLSEGMNHTAMLAPSIQNLLKASGLKTSDLGAISVSSGPGSYTGLRVGSSTAKSMAYSLNIPLIAIPTLSALASAAFGRHPEAERALPMLDARRNEVYSALFGRGMDQMTPISSLILDSLAINGLIEGGKITVVCGDGAIKVSDPKSDYILVDLEIQSSARHLVGLAWKQISSGQFSDPMHFVPYYLKPPNITQQKKNH